MTPVVLGREQLPSVTTLLTVLRWILNIVAIVAVVLYFARHRAAIVQAATGFETATIVAAMTVILAGLLPGAWAWQRLCARRLPGVTARFGILVYLRSAIGKYTPGGVLTFVIQQRLLSGRGAGPALLIQIFVGTALAACFSSALLGVPAALAVGGPWLDTRWIVLLVVLSVVVLAAGYRFRNHPVVTRLGLPPLRSLGEATVLLGVATAVTGLHLAILGSHTGAGPVFLVSAFARSTLFGLLFAVLPGAVGVRDGALLFLLATRLDPADAAMLALLSRTLIVAGDVLGTALAAFAARLHLERSTS